MIEIKPIIDSAYSIQDATNKGRLDIFEVNKELYLTVDGTFLVYKWKDNRWINLYKNNYTGYNLHSRKFLYKNRIYSFGGYGFWKYHGQLIYFIESKGEWEIVSGTENLINGYSILNGNNLYVLNPTENYSINLESSRIKFLGNKINAKQEKNYDHTPFDLTSSTTWTPSIIRWNDHKLLYSYQNTFEGIKKAFAQKGLIHIQGDTIFNYNQKYNLIKIDILSEEISQFSEIPRISIINSSLKYIYYFVGSIVCLSLILLARKRKYKETYKDEEPKTSIEFNHPIIEKLLLYDILNQEKLDELFEIQNIIPDESKKFKRSQLIKDINTFYQIKTGSILIEREKNLTDKRRFVYKICKSIVSNE